MTIRGDYYMETTNKAMSETDIQLEYIRKCADFFQNEVSRKAFVLYSE